MAAARPARGLAAFGRDGSYSTRAGIGAHVDLILTGLIGVISDPLAIGRKAGRAVVGGCLEEGTRVAGGAVGLQRKHPDLLAALTGADRLP